MKKIIHHPNESEWIEYLKSRNLPDDDINFAKMILDLYGQDAGNMDITEAYQIARSNHICTEGVSKILAYLRRRLREDKIK